MEILTVTFCGHSNVPNGDCIEQKVIERLKTLLEERKPEHAIFYCGGYGDFDGIVSRATRAVQSQFPNIKIERIFVTPYYGGAYDDHNKFMKEIYDDVLYPPLETVPKRLAIIKRNEWMVDNSDVVVAYVHFDFGGAAMTYAYAKRKKKDIINIE